MYKQRSSYSCQKRGIQKKIHKEIIEQFDMPNHKEKGRPIITATGNTEEKINPL